jgi:hypothetical protein
MIDLSSAPGKMSASLLRLWISLDSRDWSLDNVDARLYAIVVGWDGDPDDPDDPDDSPDGAWRAVAAKHGWRPDLVVELRAAHEDFKRLG